MSLEPSRTGTVTSYDGTRIAWQLFGDGPPLLLANGIGVRWKGLLPQLEALSRRYTVICWDQRGFFGSGPPAYGGVGVPAHARDALAVLDALGIRRCRFLGWSMGVQVGFAVLERAPDRFSQLACLAGSPGDAFHANLFTRPARRLIPPALDLGSHLVPLLAPGFRVLARHPSFPELARAVGFTAPPLSRDDFRRMAVDVAGHDLRLYVRTLAALGRHDASHLLDHLEQPLLFVVGSRDILVSPRHLRRLAARAPRGRVLLLRGLSHFAPIEDPEAVNAALLEFFAGEG